MAKNIMILTSSPRKHGNTNTVTRWVIEAAAAAGAEIDCIDVANLKHKVNGCIACYGCQQSDKYECVIEDETAELLKRMLDYDTLVFATPVYFFGPNAQLKLVLDRMLSHVKFDPETGEPILAAQGGAIGLIATAGGEANDGLNLTDQLFKTVAQFGHSNYLSLLVPKSPNNPQDLADNAGLKEKALDFGKSLAAD
jgi:multimeric flavodoxin WrbA